MHVYYGDKSTYNYEYDEIKNTTLGDVWPRRGGNLS